MTSGSFSSREARAPIPRPAIFHKYTRRSPSLFVALADISIAITGRAARFTHNASNSPLSATINSDETSESAYSRALSSVIYNASYIFYNPSRDFRDRPLILLNKSRHLFPKNIHSQFCIYDGARIFFIGTRAGYFSRDSNAHIFAKSR